MTGVPCNGPPQSQHHHNLSDRNMQWVSILVVIKPIPHGQRSKHVSRFIWGVVFRIYMGSQANPLHGINLILAFIHFTRLAVPICDCPIVTCGSCVSPNMLSGLKHLKPKIEPSNWSFSQSTLAKVLQEAGDADLQNELFPSHYIPWFHFLMY